MYTIHASIAKRSFDFSSHITKCKHDIIETFDRQMFYKMNQWWFIQHGIIGLACQRLAAEALFLRLRTLYKFSFKHPSRIGIRVYIYNEFQWPLHYMLVWFFAIIISFMKRIGKLLPGIFHGKSCQRSRFVVHHRSSSILFTNKNWNRHEFQTIEPKNYPGNDCRYRECHYRHWQRLAQIVHKLWPVVPIFDPSCKSRKDYHKKDHVYSTTSKKISGGTLCMILCLLLS